MNKSDLKLIIFIILISSFFIVVKFFNNSETNKKALIYYDNKMIKKLDLTIKQRQQYKIKGYNGKIIVETKEGSIRVKEEKSPLHICSKQGWVSSTYETIVCLPNKVIIKIETNEVEMDAIIR